MPDHLRLIRDAALDVGAEVHPSLLRGIVWCKRCGRSQKVDSSVCLRSGWPECCGETMTIDSPAERKRLTRKK